MPWLKPVRGDALVRSRAWALVASGLIAGCTLLDDPPAGGEQCLPYPELKRRCNAAFTDCLDSWIQSLPGDKHGHSQCYPCRDLCMRSNGVWPDEALGGPCR